LDTEHTLPNYTTCNNITHITPLLLCINIKHVYFCIIHLTSSILELKLIMIRKWKLHNSHIHILGNYLSSSSSSSVVYLMMLSVAQTT
jgi:hypothetical protein